MKLRELLSSKDKWTQGANARDKDNLLTNYSNSEATCWCLWGGCLKILIPNDNFVKLNDWIRNNTIFVSIPQFNDNTDWETINKMLNELDI